MTVVADERVPPENNQNQPKIENSGGIFYRICCCCSTSEKEPPVQLIRSGSLTYQQGSNEPQPQPQISTANESIEGVAEVQPEIEEPSEEINVNDILMDEVIRNAEEQEDKTEVLEEDVVSISSHVVQEIDEKDLNDFVKPLKARKATVTNDDSISITSSHQDQGDRKMSVIEFIRSEAEAQAEAQAEAEALEAPQKPARDPEVTTQSEISDSEEDQEVPPLPLEPPPRLTTSALENHPIPPPRSPRISKMYQNADDSDSDSDSEDGEEDQEPIGLSKMQPITFAASPKPEAEASSDSEAEAEASSASDSEAEEIGVTRISVKSNGQAQIHSPRSPVRVSLDVDRQQIVTDDEFSEKLI